MSPNGDDSTPYIWKCSCGTEAITITDWRLAQEHALAHRRRMSAAPDMQEHRVSIVPATGRLEGIKVGPNQGEA